jgi:hypothetical protein
MDFSFDGFFSTVLGQVVIFMLSLLDDALLIGLSRLGVNIPGLQWLPYLVVGGFVVHWTKHFFHHRSHRRAAAVGMAVGGDREPVES